jgi:predicted MFS family arabinose efflux permease
MRDGFPTKRKITSSQSWQRKDQQSRLDAPHRADGRLLRDKNLWLLVALLICYTSGQYGFSIWLPTLVKSLTGQNLTTVGWLTALPYLTALGGLYLFGAWNDMTRNPKLCTVLSLIGFGLCFWLATLFPRHPWFSIALLVLPGFLTKAMQAPFWMFPPPLFPPGLSGGSRGIINALGNLGGFLGPSWIGWLSHQTGDLRFGILGLSLLLGWNAGFTALLPRVTSQNSRSK